MRIRIAIVAAVMAIGAIAVPTAGASNGTTVPPKVTAVPPLYTMSISGVAKNNKRFTGTYGIQRVVVGKDGKPYAYGTLKGKLKGRHVTRYGVMMPVSLAGATGATGAQTAQAACPILHLVIGPVDLNLLGLRVRLGGGADFSQPIVLDLTAYQGQGLLGDLLCGVSNLLNQNGLLGQLTTQVQQLTATLNSLLALLGGAAGQTASLP
jgi:hypothetical protein